MSGIYNVEWTGREATALRRATRTSIDGFAALVGVSPRTVANWAARPNMVPRVSVQALLDKALHNAGLIEQGRFAEDAGVDLPPVELTEEKRAEVVAVLDQIWAQLDAIADNLHQMKAEQGRGAVSEAVAL